MLKLPNPIAFTAGNELTPRVSQSFLAIEGKRRLREPLRISKRP